MKLSRKLLFIPFIAAYCLTFHIQDLVFKDKPASLLPAPTAPFLRAAAGYLQQLTAEILFVQSSVFLGGLKPGTDPSSYAPILAHNYRQITTLYPQFIDPYYYTQSYLSYVAPEFTQATNEILSTARKAYPINLIYPFFQGFNYFRYLNDPLKAAEVFREASGLPEAPPMFAHLAVILAAQGGQLQAAVISLQAMVKSTNDEEIKKRYQEELGMFRQAVKVQKSVSDYFAKYQRYPDTLHDLVPEFLYALPSFGQRFELTWTPPNVGLRRPDIKQNNNSVLPKPNQTP